MHTELSINVPKPISYLYICVNVYAGTYMYMLLNLINSNFGGSKLLFNVFYFEILSILYHIYKFAFLLTALQGVGPQTL